jgi:hypothetical protein
MSTRTPYTDTLDDKRLAETGAVRHLAVHVANYCSTLCYDTTKGQSVGGADQRTDDSHRVTCPICLQLMSESR